MLPRDQGEFYVSDLAVIPTNLPQNGNIDDTEKAFLKEATSQGLTGLKGHRSVGGIRASSYNSIPLDGAERLAKFIEAFAKA